MVIRKNKQDNVDYYYSDFNKYIYITFAFISN